MSVKFGTPTDEQLAKINKLTKRTLSADEVFSFGGKAAGDMLIPHRYMSLSPEILKVMADDAKKGVSFMLNHNWSSRGGIQGVPYGKVFDGRVENSQDEGETVSLSLDKYIVRDSEIVDGVSADALIKRIETGVLSDTSIGWGTDVMVCSICKKNYFSKECRHWRGSSYEMGDGTQKVCTVTAMPPSVMIPNNNNVLFEESIVWDGAYPGAMVTQSKQGDIIELPTGKFTVVPDKEEYPEGTLYHGYYHNGDIVAMVKKTDKKVYSMNSKEKGSEDLMNEKLLKMLQAFGIEFKEGETKLEEILGALAEKWDATVEAIKESAEPLKEGESQEIEVDGIVFPKEFMEKEFGSALSSDELIKFAKEGIEYHKQVIEDAIAMGVKAMGNDFPAETWKQTFSTMGTTAIKEILKTWEIQAQDKIPAGRKSVNNKGEETQAKFPDEAFKVGR